MMITSENINELATALAKCQGEMGGAEMGADNPFFNSKYANVSDVLRAIKEPLANNGLSFVQTPIQHENEAGVMTRLMHSSGQWIESTLWLPVGKPDAQGVGAAITYARRYALQSILGVPAADDDGNAVSEPTITAEEVQARYLEARQILAHSSPSKFMQWRETLSEELSNMVYNSAPRGKITAFKDAWTAKETEFWKPLKVVKAELPGLVSAGATSAIEEIFDEMDEFETEKIRHMIDDVSATFIADMGI
jgi:hypothetical protein